jgi:hypothetical protein
MSSKAGVTASKLALLLAIALATSFLNAVPPAYAAWGISNITYSSKAIKAGDTFRIEFKVNRPVNPDLKYRINISFSSIRSSFNASADLLNGNYAEGSWGGNIKVPTDVYSENFDVSFIPFGSGENGKNRITTDSSGAKLFIQGKPIPSPPLIEILNIKTNKALYNSGETIEINFETKIIYGAISEETGTPEVLIQDLRFGSFVRPITNRGKPLPAKGSYSTGKWKVEYPTDPLQMSTKALVQVRLWPGLDAREISAKSEVIEIKSLVNEIKISDVVLDKESYEPNTPVVVTFKTTSTDATLTESSKPFIILTDLASSEDLSENLNTILVSGTMNDGFWKAEFKAPEFNKFNPPIKDYVLGFYNKASSIREFGPTLKIRKNPNLLVKTQLNRTYELGMGPVPFAVAVDSAIPAKSNVVSSTVCQLEGDQLKFISVGKCMIESEVTGNDEWAASKISTAIDVVAKKIVNSTITCTKGKTIKKVTAQNPKCPKGFSLKKRS